MYLDWLAKFEYMYRNCESDRCMRGVPSKPRCPRSHVSSQIRCFRSSFANHQHIIVHANRTIEPKMSIALTRVNLLGNGHVAHERVEIS